LEDSGGAGAVKGATVNYAAYDSLWKELRAIMVAESLELVYEALPYNPFNLEEGEYRAADPLRIFISDLYARNDGSLPNNEPIVVAHELGHYFDWKLDQDLSVTTEGREKRANLSFAVLDQSSYFTRRAATSSGSVCGPYDSVCLKKGKTLILDHKNRVIGQIGTSSGRNCKAGHG
jgi:hypothetical protein